MGFMPGEEMAPSALQERALAFLAWPLHPPLALGLVSTA